MQEDEVFHQMRKLAEGKLSCTCGNADWTQFLFVSPDADHAVAGCKQCGRTYNYQSSVWVSMGGPAPGRK